MQISTAGGRGRGKRSGAIAGGTFDRCACAHERGRQTDTHTRGVQDEADDARLSTCGDEGGKGGRGARAEGQDEGAQGETGTWRREGCLHLTDGDEELLQIQPVLSTAAE